MAIDQTRTPQPSANFSLEVDDLEVLVFDRLPAAEPHWRDLEAAGLCYVFQTYDWLSSWQQTVGDAAGIQPFIVWVGTKTGQGLMLLPFGVEHRHGCRVLVWLGAPLADYRGPILMTCCDDAFLEHFRRILWPTIRHRLPNVDYLHLTSQPATIDGHPNPFVGLAHRALPYCAHATALEGDWDSYYRAKRSSKSRNTERRKAKKLGTLGELSFEIATTSSTIQPMLEALFAQKSVRLAAQGAADPLAVPGMPAFIRDLTQAKLGQGLIQLAALKLDDQIIAVHWGALHRGRFYFLLPALDVAETARLSPGSILINHLLEWAFSQKLKIFDFTIGDEPYKAHWCEQQEPICETLIVVSARGRIAVWLIEMDAFIRKQVRSQSWLYALAAVTRQRFARYRKAILG